MQFNIPKLETIMERARQATKAREDLLDRHVEAVRHRSAARAAVDAIEATHGRATAAALRQRETAEAEVTRLAAAKDQLIAETNPILATARACEDWARAQGWTPEGIPGRTLPRGIVEGRAR